MQNVPISSGRMVEEVMIDSRGAKDVANRKLGDEFG